MITGNAAGGAATSAGVGAGVGAGNGSGTGTGTGMMDTSALLTQILPRADEVRWQEIPWQTDIWDARRVASQAGKPIFAWMMNGSVLGCT